MPVVLDGDTGQRVLIYGEDGATPRTIEVDDVGRVEVSDPRRGSGAIAALSYIAAGVAPHAATIRATYTVPAGRAAIVEIAQASIIRDAAPAPASIASGRVRYLPSFGGTLWLCEAVIFDAAVGARDVSAVGLTLYMAAGDTIDLETFDGSTGGTVRYAMTAKVTEILL